MRDEQKRGIGRQFADLGPKLRWLGLRDEPRARKDGLVVAENLRGDASRLLCAYVRAGDDPARDKAGFLRLKKDAADAIDAVLG